jgi:hypothetical protein
MLNLKRVGVIVCLLVALVACSGQRSIIIDTTGLTLEQIAAIEWKVKYAVALDWYAFQLSSYKANLDALPLDQSKVIHTKIGPLLQTANYMMLSFRAVAYAQNPDPAEQQEAYNAFIQAKAAVLAALIRAFD